MGKIRESRKINVIPTKKDLQEMLNADVLMDDNQYDKGFKAAIEWILNGEEVETDFDIPEVVFADDC